MIRIQKHKQAPVSLSKQSSWTEDDVIGQLKKDQYGKCYLCERVQITDFQVEHYKSRKNFPALTYEWTNLYWGCSYCNGKKSSSFDNLLNPVDENIEDLIYQSFDFPNAKALFNNLETTTNQIDSTIALLTKVFNGNNGLRTIREQQFYDYAMSRITSFQEKTLSWLKTKSDEFESAIIEELDISSEFLGFKYWIIKSNETLLKTFGQYIIWHKIK
ncbi:MAG: hypothetical protein NC102_00445 [Clostridium sp.]|nr:hypothetical protein [Clostridium sp.]